MLLPASLVLFYGLVAAIGGLAGFAVVTTITKGA